MRAIRYAIERNRLERDLANHARQLRLKNDQMQADLDLAREVQMALLPQKLVCTFHSNALRRAKSVLVGQIPFWQLTNCTWLNTWPLPPSRAMPV